MANIPDEDRVYLSAEGFEDLKRKLNDLKTKKRVEIAKHLEYAKSLGDLSENAEYHEAKEEQMSNEREISKLEDSLARAVLISNKTQQSVGIGSRVEVMRDGSSKECFVIVGREEADPVRGKISFESPLGKAVIGKRKNDKITVSTPKGKMEYLIIEIA